MGQFYGIDNIPTPVKASATSVTLAATNNGKTTRITIGGQQYPLSATLTLSTGSTGLNGLDTGGIAANTLYYLYACVNSSGVVGLVASLTGLPTGPTGFTGRFKLIGRFRTDFSGTGINTLVADSTVSPIQIIGDLNVFTPSFSFDGSFTYLFSKGTWQRIGNDMHLKTGFIISVGTNANNANATLAIPGGVTGVTGVYPEIALKDTTTPFTFMAGVECNSVSDGPTVIIFPSDYRAHIANTDFGTDGIRGFNINTTIPINEWVGLYV